jgi:hypothetical protein
MAEDKSMGFARYAWFLLPEMNKEKMNIERRTIRIQASARLSGNMRQHKK